jgi:nucleoid DNA-binding protein
MKNKPSPLTRAEIIQELRDRLSLSGKDAGKILENFLECVSEILEGSGQVSLIGLGRFQIKRTPSRPGRNPKTGHSAEVPAKLRPTFTMSRVLRDKMMECWANGTFMGVTKKPREKREIASPASRTDSNPDSQN